MADRFPFRRICLYGGPGIGKSVLAANIFAKLKISGHNVELVQEFVKFWAYEKKTIASFDQCYIFAKQQRLEDRVLRAAVDLIVTDSPLLMQCVYARKYNCMGWKELISIGKMFDEVYPSLNFLLKRPNSVYQTEGRYQSEQEAKDLDVEIEAFMNEYNIVYENIESNNVFERIMEYTRGE